jgi:hypothetical protein
MKDKSAKLALTLTSSALLASGVVQAGDAPKPAPSAAPSPTAVQAAKLAALNKAELRKMLARIEQAKAPEPKMGAMCYEMVAPPERMEYVCPQCGERTLYAKDVAWKWNFELDNCRRLFKELPKRETMTLDESSFCRKCHPGTNAPSLKLQIRYDNGSTNTVPNITSDDLRILAGFFFGKLEYPTANDGTGVLKKELPRLRQLLGIKDE